jgi:undecaprenyl-diphosphatase
VPTLFAASAYKLMKTYKQIGTDDVSMLITGNAVAFIVAIIAIKTFITLITRYGFKPFGYYRIALGIILLVLLSMGKNLNIH